MSGISGVRISNLSAQIAKGKPDKGYPMEGPEVRGPHNIFPSSIAGLPGHPVQDVVLENINIVYDGSANKSAAHVGINALSSIPEAAADYPEFSMFGELPAWGFYARHAKGIVFKNVTLSCRGTDFRQVAVFDDVADLSLEGITVPRAWAQPPVVLQKCDGALLRNIQVNGNTADNVLIR